MTEKEAREAIKEIPIGSRVQLLKTNGDIIEVRLASHEVGGTERKDYGEIVVPALPPAITVLGSLRWGQYRIDTEDLVKIAWVD